MSLLTNINIVTPYTRQDKTRQDKTLMAPYTTSVHRNSAEKFNINLDYKIIYPNKAKGLCESISHFVTFTYEFCDF